MHREAAAFWAAKQTKKRGIVQAVEKVRRTFSTAWNSAASFLAALFDVDRGLGEAAGDALPAGAHQLPVPAVVL